MYGLFHSIDPGFPTASEASVDDLDFIRRMRCRIPVRGHVQ